MSQATWDRKGNKLLIVKEHEQYLFTIGESNVMWRNTESNTTRYLMYFIDDYEIRLRFTPAFTQTIKFTNDHPVYKAYVDAVTERELFDSMHSDSGYY